MSNLTVKTQVRDGRPLHERIDVLPEPLHGIIAELVARQAALEGQVAHLRHQTSFEDEDMPYGWRR